jgi:hypothetical protein
MSVCSPVMSVCFPVCSKPTGRNFLKFHIWYFYEDLSKNSKIWSKLRNIRHLYEYVSTFIFVTTVASILWLDRIEKKEPFLPVRDNSQRFYIYHNYLFTLFYLSSLRLWQLFGIVFCCYLVGTFYRPRCCLIKPYGKF